MQAPSRFDQATGVAARRAVAAGVSGAVALGVVLAVLVSILVGVIVMVVLGAAWALWVQSSINSALDVVLVDMGEPVAQDDLPRFRNALEGVALLTGVATPELRLIDSPTANAMVAAGRDRATVVVTSGLLEGHRSVEVEVLAAELLCRVRDGSARYATLAAGLPAAMAWIAGLGDAAVASTLGDQRATRADFDAVSVTRYPPGLISALESMSQRGTAVRGASPRTAPLWIAPAVGTDAGVSPELDRTANQPLDYRIAVLREL